MGEKMKLVSKRMGAQIVCAGDERRRDLGGEGGREGGKGIGDEEGGKEGREGRKGKKGGAGREGRVGDFPCGFARCWTHTH